jgi:hypothetical protein
MTVSAVHLPRRNAAGLRLSDADRQRFLGFLPLIRRMARRTWRHLPVEEQDERVQNVVGFAYAFYVRLVERGRPDAAYASALARFAIRRTRSGSRLGTPDRRGDVLDPRTRLRRVPLESAGDADESRGALLADRRPDPAELTASRIDVRAWLKRLSPHQRRIAQVLAQGATTSAAAEQFRISRSRISQLRRELAESWERFQGDAPHPAR